MTGIVIVIFYKTVNASLKTNLNVTVADLYRSLSARLAIAGSCWQQSATAGTHYPKDFGQKSNMILFFAMLWVTICT